MPHERVDRRDEVACGDGARLAGSGVEQSEEDAAHEPGKFVTEGVEEIFPPSPSASPPPPVRSLADVGRDDAHAAPDGGAMTVGWVSLGHKGNVHGDVCVQRGGIGEGG